MPRRAFYEMCLLIAKNYTRPATHAKLRERATRARGTVRARAAVCQGVSVCECDVCECVSLCVCDERKSLKRVMEHTHMQQQNDDTSARDRSS